MATTLNIIEKTYSNKDLINAIRGVSNATKTADKIGLAWFMQIESIDEMNNIMDSVGIKHQKTAQDVLKGAWDSCKRANKINELKFSIPTGKTIGFTKSGGWDFINPRSTNKAFKDTDATPEKSDGTTTPTETLATTGNDDSIKLSDIIATLKSQLLSANELADSRLSALKIANDAMARLNRDLENAKKENDGLQKTIAGKAKEISRLELSVKALESKLLAA